MSDGRKIQVAGSTATHPLLVNPNPSRVADTGANTRAPPLLHSMPGPAYWVRAFSPDESVIANPARQVKVSRSEDCASLRPGHEKNAEFAAGASRVPVADPEGNIGYNSARLANPARISPQS